MVYRLKAKIRSVVCILLVAVILAGSLPGCGVIKGDTVMEYEGYKITEAMYSYWMSRYKTLFLYAYNNSKDTEAFWNTEVSEGVNYEQFVVSYINDYAKRVLVAMKLFDDYSLVFSESVRNGIDEQIDVLTEAYGTRSDFNNVLAEYGLNIKTLETIYYAQAKLDAVNEYLFGEGGIYQVTDTEREEYYLNNYYCVEWIYIYTDAKPRRGEDGGFITDITGSYIFDELSEEEQREQQEKIEELVKKLDEGGDFKELREEYSEEILDTYEYLPDGVNVSANDYVNYGTGFIKLVQGLEIGSYGRYEEEHAVFIVKRYDLKDFGELTETELAVMNDFELYVADAKEEEFYSDIEVTVNTEVADRYDIRQIKGLTNTNI